jgi:hypothetical protein
MKRLAAIVLAIGMVFGALALRNSLEKNTPAQTATGRDSPFRLNCSTELADVCAELQGTEPNLIVKTEEAGVTADRLTLLSDGTDPGFDAWLTIGPWAEIVQDNRSYTENKEAILGTPSSVLASSPAEIVTSKAGEATLKAACGGAITWKCLGANQSLPQPQSIGMASPNTGAGLAVLADATNSFFGNNGYSATDFEDATFPGWFEQLTKKSQDFALGEQTVLERAVAAAGTFTTVGALSTEVESLETTSSKFNSVPAPKDAPDQPVIAQVRLVPAAGITAQDALNQVDSDALTQLLAESNWNTSDQDSPSNMPAAGVLQVLRDMWDS